MSTLFTRIQNSNADNKLQGTKEQGEASKSLEELLNDNTVIDSGLMGFIDDTTTIFDYDNKIDA